MAKRTWLLWVGQRLSVLLLLALLYTRPALAIEIDEILELSQAALEDYDNFEFELADNKMTALVKQIEAAQLQDPKLANVYVIQAIIGYGRYKDAASTIAEARANQAFFKAVEANPNVELPKDYATPTLEAFLEEIKTTYQEAASANPNLNQLLEARMLESSNKPMLAHTAQNSAKRCQALEIVSRASNHPEIYRVMLYFSENGQRFQNSEMRPTVGDSTRFSIELPYESTQGDFIYYYIEAYNRDNQTVANVASRAEALRISLNGECNAAKFRSQPLSFHMQFTLGTGFGLVHGKTMNCPYASGICVNNGDSNPDLSLGAALVPLYLRSTFLFYLGTDFQLGFYVRAQFININTTSRISSYDKLRASLMLGATARYFVLNTEPHRFYVGAEIGWGGANASIFLGPKFNNFVDMYLFDGPIHVSPQLGYLWSITPNVGLAFDLSIPIHFPNRPAIHFDFSVGPILQF